MTSSTLFSDVVLPAATWYEKHDINTTDMHPFVHSFNPAIAPPWQSKSDWETWKGIAKRFSEARRGPPRHPQGTSSPSRWHDTPEAMATGTAWSSTGAPVRAGARQDPSGLVAVAERDYGAIYDKMTAIGPSWRRWACSPRAWPTTSTAEVELRERNGTVRTGVADGQLRWETDIQVARRSCTLAGHQWAPGQDPGFRVPREAHRNCSPTCRPEASRSPSPTPRRRRCRSSPSPSRSGRLESGGRRYSPFTINIERSKPFHVPGPPPAVLPRPRLDDRDGRGQCRSTDHR